MSAPPPPPPPPPGEGFGGPPRLPPASSSMKSSVSSNRSAMLADIRNKPRLKSTNIVNDRSAPLLSNSKPNNTSSGSSGTANPSSGNSVAPSPLGLGGLFANGMPKLKPTGSRLLPDKKSPTAFSPGSTVNSKPKSPIHNSSESISKNTRLNSSLNKNRSNSNQRLAEINNNNNDSNHSSSSSPEIANTRKKLSETLFNNSNNNLHTSSHNNTGANNNKPVPPQKYHTINTRKLHNYSAANQDSAMPAHKGQAPQPPVQKSTLHRSNSQNNTRSAQRPSPRPPNVKPPPPPKIGLDSNSSSNRNVSKVSAAPPITLPGVVNSAKTNSTPSVTSSSKQNSTGANFKSSLHSTLLQNSQVNSQSVKPPAPPRNSSYPTSLSSAVDQRPNSQDSRASTTNSSSTFVSHSNSNHKPIRPPSGPPPPPPNRVSSVSSNTNRNQDSAFSSRQNVNSGNKSTAPPIPQHIVENSNLDALPPPPPLPVRYASLTRDGTLNSSSYQNRFKFRDIYELPAPPAFQNMRKTFPSQLQNRRRREPPPPPPPALPGATINGPINSFPDKRVHIQINRRMA